jgi:translation initiation factor IF-3
MKVENVCMSEELISIKHKNNQPCIMKIEDFGKHDFDSSKKVVEGD